MLRKISLLLALLAYTIPPAWAYFAARAAIEQMRKEEGWVCGNPIVAIYLLALLGSALLAAVALGCGAVAYRRLAAPRPLRRLGELIGISLPLLLAVATVVGLASL